MKRDEAEALRVLVSRIREEGAPEWVAQEIERLLQRKKGGRRRDSDLDRRRKDAPEIHSPVLERVLAGMTVSEADAAVAALRYPYSANGARTVRKRRRRTSNYEDLEGIVAGLVEREVQRGATEEQACRIVADRWSDVGAAPSGVRRVYERALDPDHAGHSFVLFIRTASRGGGPET